MTEFYLMRHAEADYTYPVAKGTLGWGMDMAPLTPKGRLQAEAVIEDLRKIDPEIILMSPTTRTMETALIVLREIQVGFRVEFDLHEWVPDWRFTWAGLPDVLRIQDEFEKQEGEHLNGNAENWESLSAIRKRVTNVLNQYRTYSRVLVICHGMVIRSMTGVVEVENTQIVRH